MLEVATIAIRLDEPAYFLQERNVVLPPHHRGVQRVQRIIVNRNDRLASYEEILGDANQFRAPEIDIPSYWAHTVGELRDIAERYRLGDDFGASFLAEKATSSTLVRDIITEAEQRQQWKARRSQFGPKSFTQR